VTTAAPEYRPLQGTDLVTSRAVLGTMTFGAQLSAEDSAIAVDLAIGSGVNHFDCANSYTEGAAEEVLGRALGTRRAEVIVSTKAFNKVRGVSGLGRTAVIAALEDSLRRLGTDYVDLFYLHQPDWGTPLEETLAAVDTLVSQGKVRFPAVSNYAAWQIAQARSIQEAAGYRSLHVSQVMYNVITRDIDQEYSAFADAYSMSTLVYNPLAGGLLTGKYSSLSESVAPGTRFSGEQYRDRYWSERQLAAARKVGVIASEAGMTPVELSLGWALGRPIVDAVILGGSSIEQLTANLAAIARGPLSAGLMDACDEVWQDLRGPLPRYNR